MSTRLYSGTFNSYESTKDIMKEKKKELLKRAQVIIPDMKICKDKRCRYCTIRTYPKDAPCVMCEKRNNKNILTTNYTCPETKLIHEYYAPVCSNECMEKYFKADEEEFDRKMANVFRKQGLDMFWSKGKRVVKEKAHPMFVDIRESVARPDHLFKEWYSRRSEAPSTSFLKILINDSPTLSKPSEFILHSSESTQLLFELLSKYDIPQKWTIEYPDVALPDEFVISAIVTLSDFSEEPVVLRLQKQEAVSVWYYYDKMNESFFQKVSKSEENAIIVSLLIPAIALGINYNLAELIFYGLLLKKYLLKLKPQRKDIWKLAALCMKHNSKLLLDNRDEEDIPLDGYVGFILEMGTYLGCCNEFELLCLEYDEAIAFAERQPNHEKSTNFMSLLNSSGLAYKTIRQYKLSRESYEKAASYAKDHPQLAPVIKRNLHLLNDAEKTSKLGTKEAEVHLVKDRLKQVEGHMRDAGVLLLDECEGCGKQEKGMANCSACKKVKYCSRECQKQHWSKHKQHCVKL